MDHYLRIITVLWLVALATPAIAEHAYTPEVAVIRFISTHDVRADGSDRESQDVVLQVETVQGISDAGAQRIGYRSSVDDVEAIEASTIKPDGTEIVVPANAIRTQDEDSDGGATEFSDTKYKVIVFPAVEVGSKIHYRVLINQRTTPFPGFFSEAYVLAPQWSREHWEVNINIPSGLPLYVEQRGIAGGLESTKDGINHYHFSYRGTEAKAPESGSVWAGEYAPVLFVSTYSNMIAVGTAYQAAAAPMARVTDRILALANELTAGATRDEAKVKALDHWVAKNIRYVSVTLGHGGLIPHPADQVLANRYGDCKDHAILMEALLRAVGIESSGALVNSGSAYTLATVGAIGPPNHIITYVPSLDLYVDSTDQFSHFGTLSFGVMDKPTVLTALGRLGRTPRMRADQNVERAVIEMVIRPDGSIQGNTSTSVSGVWESESRADRFYAQSTAEEQVVKNLLYRFNETGSGALEYADPTVLDQQFWIKSTFRLDPVTNFPGPGALMTPVGLSPGMIANIGVHKPLDKVLWSYSCRSRILEDSYRIEFPATVVLGKLPKGVNYTDGGVHYQSTYEKQGHAMIVHRELSVQRAGDVCTPRDNEAWLAFHAVLQRDLRSQMFYR